MQGGGLADREAPRIPGLRRLCSQLLPGLAGARQPAPAAATPSAQPPPRVAGITLRRIFQLTVRAACMLTATKHSMPHVHYM